MYLPNPSAICRVWHMTNFFISFKQITAGLKAKEPSLPYYLPIAGEEKKD